MSISSLHDRIYRQRIFPECIKTCPFIHGRNNQRVFESNHFSGLTIIEVLVSILQSIDAVFTRSNTPNCETSATVGTTYTFKGIVVKAESAKLECIPTSIPFTGSRLAAFSTVPETTIESITEPVEKVNPKSGNGLPSLLS